MLLVRRLGRTHMGLDESSLVDQTLIG
jgi:hypothetical protein